jgi:hypothetical protein
MGVISVLFNTQISPSAHIAAVFEHRTRSLRLNISPTPHGSSFCGLASGEAFAEARYVHCFGGYALIGVFRPSSYTAHVGSLYEERNANIITSDIERKEYRRERMLRAICRRINEHI